jgi:hypothetical protein
LLSSLSRICFRKLPTSESTKGRKQLTNIPQQRRILHRRDTEQLLAHAAPSGSLVVTGGKFCALTLLSGSASLTKAVSSLVRRAKRKGRRKRRRSDEARRRSRGRGGGRCLKERPMRSRTQRPRHENTTDDRENTTETVEIDTKHSPKA